MTDLQSLLTRLEEAEGPSEALDVDLTIAFGLWSPPTGSKQDLLFPARFNRGQFSARCPHKAYTRSLDAALALVERVLPGWTIANIGQQDDGSWWAELREGFTTSYGAVATSDTRARPKIASLALLSALLRAKLSEGAK